MDGEDGWEGANLEDLREETKKISVGAVRREKHQNTSDMQPL